MDGKLIFVSSHPTYFRLNLSLGEGLNLAVGLYAMAVPAKIPGSIKLYRETNKQVHSKTQTFHTQTGSLLLPSEIKKAQVRAGWHRMLQRCTVHPPSSRKTCVCSGVREEADSDGEGRGGRHQEV